MRDQKFPDVFSTQAAARLCHVTPMTIIRWINEGRIRAYKTPGGHRRIMKADLEKFCTQCGIPFVYESQSEVDQTPRVLVIGDQPNDVDAIVDALVDRSQSEDAWAFKIATVNDIFDAGYVFADFRPHTVFVDLDMAGLAINALIASCRRLAQGDLRIIGVGRTAVAGLDAFVPRPIAAQIIRAVTGPMPKL